MSKLGRLFVKIFKMEKKKILLIDDDVDFLAELAEMLKLSGYEPACVSDASRALSVALDMDPDVILLDLKMFGLNGFQLADRFSQNELLKNIPIIAMSGHFIHDKHNMLMGLYGINYFLEKPFDSFGAIIKIETALAGAEKKGIMIRKDRR